MFGENELGPVLTGLGGGSLVVTALFWLVRSIVRRTSRDAVEMAKDRAETQLVQMLSDTNQRLTQQINDLSRERNEALAGKGTLEATNASLAAMIKNLREENTYLRSLLATQLSGSNVTGVKS